MNRNELAEELDEITDRTAEIMEELDSLPGTSTETRQQLVELHTNGVRAESLLTIDIDESRKRP